MYQIKRKGSQNPQTGALVAPSFMTGSVGLSAACLFASLPTPGGGKRNSQQLPPLIYEHGQRLTTGRTHTHGHSTSLFSNSRRILSSCLNRYTSSLLLTVAVLPSGWQTSSPCNLFLGAPPLHRQALNPRHRWNPAPAQTDSEAGRRTTPGWAGLLFADCLVG